MGVDNLLVIEQNKKDIIVNLVLEKTKCCSLHWSQLAPNFFEATFNQAGGEVFWVVKLEKIINQSNTRYFLQIYRNDSICLQLTDLQHKAIAETFDIIKEVVLPDNKIQEAIDVLGLMTACIEWDTYDEIASGGVVANGQAVERVILRYNETGSGGVVCAGAGNDNIVDIYDNFGSGGVVCAGVAIEFSTNFDTYNETGSGGIVCAGGGVVFGTGADTYNETGSGGVVCAGVGSVNGGFGPELITNGTFDNANGWTLLTMDVESGRLREAESVASQPKRATHNTVNFSSSKTYRLTFGVFTPINGTWTAQVDGNTVFTFTTTGNKSTEFTPASTGLFRFNTTGIAAGVRIDDVSIREKLN